MSNESFPETLENLLSTLQTKQQNAIQSEVIEWLHSFCETFHLKIHCHKQFIPSGEKKRAKIPAQETQGNTQPSHHVHRVVLSRAQPVKAQESLLTTMCNGLVLDANTWTCLAIPPPAPFQQATRQVQHFYRNNFYEVVPIQDGTLLTIYYWDDPEHGPSWCLASTHGYDVSNYCWIGDKTFAELVYELLQQHSTCDVTLEKNKTQGTRLFFNNLNPDYCYTIGIRHHNLQPLIYDPQNIWAIQSTNLKTLKTVYPEYYGYIGIPGIQSQVPELPQYDLPYLIRSYKTAMNQAKNAIKNGKKDKEYFNYGYLLISRAPAITKSTSNVLLKSPLLVFLQKSVYQKKHNISNSQRLEFIILQNYLMQHFRDHFIALFPQYISYYTKYQNMLNMIIHSIATKDKDHPFAGAVVKKVLEDIENAENIIDHTTIQNYAHQSKYAMLYLSIISHF
ncbi:pM448R [African swine fever virus]|uniref:PM448R n=1 Tax=African swine fever virus TaxID=10497 RepID=A0A6G6AGJ4_ASF|nr:pM448R [African swine fever virus]